MVQTIRRNTRRFEQVLNSAYEIHVHNLDNYFRGRMLHDDSPEQLTSARGWLRDRLETFRRAKLMDQGDGKYTLWVHGNLWYDFQAGPSEMEGERS